MKKSVWIPIAVLVLAIAVFGVWRWRSGDPTSGPGPSASADSVRVGVILSLSGPPARFDAIKIRTAEIATQRIRELHPDLPLAMRVFDAGAGPEETMIAVRRAEEWGARYFLSGTSPNALAIASRVRGRTPPVVQMANAANPDFGPPREGEYRLWPDWKHEAELIDGLLAQQQFNRVLLVHSADPYSEALKNELVRISQGRGGVTLQFQQYDPASTPDFRPALLRARQQGTQALVIFGLPPGIRSLISQMEAVRWNGPVIGGVNINLAVAAFDSAGLGADLWAIETEAMGAELPPGSEAAAFRQAYRATHGEAAPFHALYLADGLYFIAAGHATGAPDSSAVARIRGVRSFAGASGEVTVTGDGDLRYRMSARQLRGGQP
jgi:ABC-type branched-subunit amino acid transport system substrate-binding protein